MSKNMLVHVLYENFIVSYLKGISLTYSAHLKTKFFPNIVYINMFVQVHKIMFIGIKVCIEKHLYINP